MIWSCFRSWSSWTALFVGLTELGCCASAGAADKISAMSASALIARRSPATQIDMPVLPVSRLGLRRDGLAIGGLPAPRAGAIATPQHPLLVDLGDDVAVAGEQRLGRAHLRAERQLAFGEPVGAVLLVLRLAAVGLGTAGAIGALVHLAARTEVADLGILQSAE